MLDAAPMYETPRTNAIAEPPLAELLPNCHELARGWALALIQALPAQAIGEVPLENIAREAPALCEQLLRALASDAELERLALGQAPSARSLSAMCGACDDAALVRAVESLRGVLWNALLADAGEPSARRVGELADRLAHVCSALLAGALAHAPRSAHTLAASVVEAPRGAHAMDASIMDEREEQRQHSPAPEGVDARRRSGRAVIVDEHEPGGVSEDWEETALAAPEPAQAEIEIRDERGGEEGPAAWVGPIGAQLERFERDRLPFAVLLVEPVELERLRREQSQQELWRASELVEQALAAELVACSGTLTRERAGRWWLLAPDTDKQAAERLAQRLLVAGAAAARELRAAALAIGTAVCPQDGRQAAALAAHADVGLYAARAAPRAPVSRRPAPVGESGP
jgi:hypothetical protein